jgi:uncharacterized protein YjiK
MKRTTVLFFLATLSSVVFPTTNFAQDDTAFIRRVRDIHTNELGLPNPAGLSFSIRSNTFHVLAGVESARLSVADIFLLTPTEDLVGSLSIPAQIKDPIFMAFDNKTNRLLIFEFASKSLIELKVGPDGNLDSSTLARHKVHDFDIQNPQGMTVDPESGHLLILDVTGPRIVRIESDPDGRFDSALISQVDLQLPGLVDPRGLALDPTTGHLHVLSLIKQKLYELSMRGQIVATRDLAELDLSDFQGMVFAPSSDLTDDPLELSLYIADSGPGALQDQRTSLLEGGRIIELSLNQPAALQAMALEPMSLEASTTQGSLVQTIDTSLFSPPSPDPAGITYLNSSDTLLFSDSEVNEMAIFTGKNLFEMTHSGNLIDTLTTTSFSNEPTGVAYNPDNEHLFISDDNAREIFEVDPGPDGLYDTLDDIVTSFDTTAFNSTDPEGVAYDTWQGVLFIADGKNNEVYRVTPGANGIFDGSPPSGDDQVSSFDTAVLGITDPEGITFDTDNGYLYLVGKPNSLMAHVTSEGALVRMLDISAAGAKKPAGLAYGPSSVNPSEMNVYITERGVDNGSDPNENDGKVYEMSFPPITQGNTAPTVDAGPDMTLNLPENSVLLDGTVTDDGLPDPPGVVITTWSQVSGAGTVVFDNAGAVDTAANFSDAGDYVLRLTADDGELTASDEVTIVVYDSGGGINTIEVRVAAGSDDAEERDLGSMYLTSTDLELVFDKSDQTVGMRFSGVHIPQGATIFDAYIQFKVDQANTVDTSLTIRGEYADNSSTFVSSSYNISSRPLTTVSTSWSPGPWTTIGEAGLNQQTPNIAWVIQEIVDRPGWMSGNALAVIITGTGERTAESYEGDQAGAPLLHIEYGFGSNNLSPTVSISAPADGSSFNFGDPVTFTGTGSDVEDGDLTNSLSWSSDLDGSLGTGGSVSTSSLSIGTHTITASVTDSGGLEGTDQITVTVNAASNSPPVASNDSATMTEDTAVTITVLANDTDVDGDTLTVSAPPA